MVPGGVGGVMSAGHWGTAAIVWAYTEDAQGSNQYGSRIDEKSPRLSITDFAQQKIRGLSTRDSVRKYRSAWEYAIEEGWAKPAVPGEAVTLPEQPFKTDRAQLGRLADRILLDGGPPCGLCTGVHRTVCTA